MAKDFGKYWERIAANAHKVDGLKLHMPNTHQKVWDIERNGRATAYVFTDDTPRLQVIAAAEIANALGMGTDFDFCEPLLAALAEHLEAMSPGTLQPDPKASSTD